MPSGSLSHRVRAAHSFHSVGAANPSAGALQGQQQAGQQTKQRQFELAKKELSQLRK